MPVLEVVCPQDRQPGIAPENDILGCGTRFDAEPDDEGWVECPHCGIEFRAAEPVGVHLVETPRREIIDIEEVR